MHARAQKDKELENFYTTQENECFEEMIWMLQSKRW
jgi:hypothetical protein